MTRRFFQALIALTALITLAPAAGEEFSAPPTFLPVHEAFKVSAIGTPDAIQVYLVAAPGYYLYKSKLGFSVAGTGVTAGSALLPAGELKTGVWGAMEQKVHLSPTSAVQSLLPRHRLR
ncbi:hypothetical protein KY380_26685 [Pseudomonas sp. HD6421]|nr:hypothetical protein [Pseudomonas sp. HD6422]MCT8186330.1 hypothetical protein [Pseudomonas sp. HD6421]